jgi:ATP adenylyltransferase
MSEYFFNFKKLSYIYGGKPPQCILCSIRDGDDTVERLVFAENKYIMLAVNLYPFNTGHCLIFPKRHVLDIRELTENETQALVQGRKILIDIVEQEYQAQGFNIGFNMGKAAGASIDHLHEHLIPRYNSEIGIADFLSGKRVMIEDPRTTSSRLKFACKDHADFDSLGFYS